MKISIVGNGNLAQSLAKVFLNRSYDVVEMHAPNYNTLQEFCQPIGVNPQKNISELNTDIDFLIISVADDALESFVKQLPVGDYIVLHTSGTVSVDVFKETEFKKVGIFYPLFSFLKGKDVDFKRVPLMIEASDKSTLKQIEKLSASISDNVVEVNSEDRKLYHLSGVMVNNFTNHFWAMTQELLEKHQLDFENLKPILKQTTERALESKNLLELQTGPAKRNDVNIIQNHLSILKENLPLQDLYTKMTELIIEAHKK